MPYYVDYYPNNLLKISPKVYRDARGFFFELFQKEEYKNIPGLACEFTQTNFAYSFSNHFL